MYATASCSRLFALDAKLVAPDRDTGNSGGKPGAGEFLTRIVLEGSSPYSSHWKGKVSGLSMPPNAVAITEGNARRLVDWILALGR
ncbi:MAG: hypothetical protein PHG21_01105 [Azoarcus sp.]|jgi:hypothetical protein|nr:hypothetical protein [Azoarcus sp.]MDD2872201.1 hypothetical protein [Azoarcus sp.]